MLVARLSMRCRHTHQELQVECAVQVRQIVGLAGSMQSGVGSSSTASTMSESMDDAALLEALKAQKAASDEVCVLQQLLCVTV